jgi:hypothetical protein
VKRALVALALVAAASAAEAQAQSGRWGSFEIGAGGYRPDIDSEFSSAPGPYQQTFGSGHGWMFRLGVSKALYTDVGSLELGLQTGYFQEKGKGRFADGTGASDDDTKFRVVPASLVLTYRFDSLAERWSIPLAPYARAALERYHWWVTDGSGDSAEDGATNGWSVAGGLALLLDFFDPDLARELDRDTGVNHTYLFFEAKKSWIDDFGSSSSWDLSEENVSLTGGLLFVF